MIQYAETPKVLCAAFLHLHKQLSFQEVPQVCVDFALSRSLIDDLCVLSQCTQCF